MTRPLTMCLYLEEADAADEPRNPRMLFHGSTVNNPYMRRRRIKTYRGGTAAVRAPLAPRADAPRA
eukprot:CAMPEP_0180170070 /NCGR_PEP_ID=MMETSP0986-20121125/33620_1 /TAXON_ID=697907 /ORGANISM="non described non described, Strain CCMP2293" /LENGTH=65 /DNA_ID=CAMNT_0022121715 /DNA_START=27 /DNA_END=221 /DNA_ORIENTATION=-